MRRKRVANPLGKPLTDSCGLQALLLEEDVLKSNVFADPKSVLKPGVRELLTIGFSDQVPLWAKSESSKMVVSSEELSGITSEDRKQFQLIRKDLLEAVNFFNPMDGSSQVVALEGNTRDAGARRIAGSLTAKGLAENSKFRITYEARQRIVGLPVGSDGVRGTVRFQQVCLYFQECMPDCQTLTAKAGGLKERSLRLQDKKCS